MSKLLKYYKPYAKWVLLAFVLLFLQAQADLALPDFMSNIVSNGIAVSDIPYIIKNGLIMLLISFGGLVASVLVGYIASRVGAASARDVRSGIFSTVSTFSNHEFDTFSVSSLITRSTNDISQLQIFSIMLIRMVFYAPIMGVGGVIKAFEKSREMPELAQTVLIAVTVLIVGLVVLLAIVQPKFVRVQKLLDKLNLVSREGLTGMMVVRAFNTESYEEERFDSVNRELTGVNLFVNRFMVLLMPFMSLIMNGVSLSVIWLASISASNVADIGNMMAFMQYATQIIMSFMMISMVFVLMPRAFVSARRVADVLGTEPTIKNKPDAITAKNIRGELCFDNVSFSYPDSDEPIIKNISFTARPGETTAFIGSTGCGKSTIVQLIGRLYDTSVGRVLLDGTDIREYTFESLRQNIGYVPQKNLLFSGTIRENIVYGKQDASDAAVQEAIDIAQASEFISQNPNGLNGEVAQGGGNVSGGQKQRLSIARAIVKNPPVYVFDDSFSALDFKTDATLRQALKSVTKNSSVLLVAQRVSTIMNAEQIIVLDQGEIVGKGTHTELLKNCPVYYDIARSQLSADELGEVK